MIPLEVPGIGVYECSDGHVYGYVGAPGGATWGDLLGWMEEEGKAEDLSEEPYRDVCMSLNLRFLASIATDPEICKKLGLLPRINEVLRSFAVENNGRCTNKLIHGSSRVVSTPETSP
jgi:hypothetical protein